MFYDIYIICTYIYIYTFSRERKYIERATRKLTVALFSIGPGGHTVVKDHFAILLAHCSLR